MGKPFAKELEKVYESLDWGFSNSCENVRTELLSNEDLGALYVVGSGGSLSACYFAAMLYQQHGYMAKAVPPLELFYSRSTLRTSKVLFISASGRNNDILFGYKSALAFEPKGLYSLTMKTNTPLAKLSSENNIGKHFEFDLPAGKDGFLATNSLVGFFSVLYNALSKSAVKSTPQLEPRAIFFDELDEFIKKITHEHTFTILYAGWGQPVAIDLESKLAEAALADVLVSDVRNFGHGRHHWFAKRKIKSAIIALITPEEKRITEKTLSLLPDDISVLRIESSYSDGLASIEMLIKSFYFINKLGQLQGIDPGRPGVPDFGSKLYHLRYGNFYKINQKSETSEIHTAILRKTKLPSLDHLDKQNQNFWIKSYHEFIQKLTNTYFGSIIFDYDGTLCSTENRWSGIQNDTANYLNLLLEKDIVIGIATGRGGSVGEDLREKLAEKHWHKVFIGYYNCGEITTLSDKDAPNSTRSASKILSEIFEKLKNYKLAEHIVPELKPCQIIIKMTDPVSWRYIRSSVIQFIHTLAYQNIQILESSHSLDIIEANNSYKLKIKEVCVAKAITFGSSPETLCIGDKGKWPGNDYQLLSHTFSLSVDEVSSLPDSCWNLAKPGIRNIDALHGYLDLIRFKGSNFKLEL